MSMASNMERIDAEKLVFLIKNNTDPNVPKNCKQFADHMGVGSTISNAKQRGILKKGYRLLLEGYFKLPEGSLLKKDETEAVQEDACFTIQDRAMLERIEKKVDRLLEVL